MSDDEGSDGGPRSRLRQLRDDVTSQFAPGVLVRLQYAAYLFTGLLVCLVLKGTMGQAMSNFHYLQKGCLYAASATDQAGSSEAGGAAAAIVGHVQEYASHVCYGNAFVYRVSFALFIFFVVMLLSVSDLTCCIDDAARAEFQRGFFCWKSALLTLLNIVMLWIPNDFFAAYAWVCMIVSGIFLVVQVMLLVDFSYVWNEEWGQRADENVKWQWYLVVVAFLCYASGIGMTIYGFVQFVPHSDCNMHGFVIVANALAAVLYTAVSVWVPHGSIVPSGIMFAYTSFLVLTALRLTDDPTCNLLAQPAGHTGIKMTLVSAVVSAVALAYSVVSCGGATSADSLSLNTNDADDAPAAADDGESSTRGRRFTTAIGHLPAYLFFYMIMIAGSMYLAMLGTDWQVSGGSTNNPVRGSGVAQWVKLSTCWLAIAMYLWSLIAPYYCCRDRDFGYDIPQDW